MERRQSVLDNHELLVLISRWEKMDPMKFPSPPEKEQFVLLAGIHQYVNHSCRTKIDRLMPGDPGSWLTPIYKTIMLTNYGAPQLGMVAAAQCLLCGIILWERIVCRNRSLSRPGDVCVLPRHHPGPCEWLPLK